MVDFDSLDVVVAGRDASGQATFLDPGEPARLSVPGVVDCSFIWATEGLVDLRRGIGGPSPDVGFPFPAGTRFGLVSLAPHSAGKMNLNETLDDQHVEIDNSDPAMHQTNSIDYEVVISGKVDIVLQNGERRTLTPGSCLVMGGVAHAWENRYDEPCVYAAIIVGARA